MTSETYADAYKRGFKGTVRFLKSRGVESHDAEELSQAAWARGWERRATLRDEGLVTTWVNAIALNGYRGTLRRVRFNQQLIDTQSVHGIDTAAMDVRRILKLCRPKERTLLEHHLTGATTDEIARKTGVTRVAIRLRLLRARRAVREALEQRAAGFRQTSAD